jgi:hypothetical protein
MRAPADSSVDKIIDDICRRLHGKHRRVDMVGIVKREIIDLTEEKKRFAPLLGAKQVAREAERLVKLTAKLERAYRELAGNPLLADSPLLNRPSFFSFAEAEPSLELTHLIQAMVPKFPGQAAPGTGLPSVDLRGAADVLKSTRIVLDWLTQCCGPHGHAELAKCMCACGALRLIERGLNPDKAYEITALLFEAVTGAPDDSEFAFTRALAHAREAWKNAKRKD